MLPDEIAVEVLKQVDGSRTIDAIADHLAVQFIAPRDEILADILAGTNESPCI